MINRTNLRFISNKLIAELPAILNDGTELDVVSVILANGDSSLVVLDKNNPSKIFNFDLTKQVVSGVYVIP